MAEPFFTIGHSNRSFEAFLALLQPNGIARVIDVRTVPRSRANPQYDGAVLAGALERAGIAYDALAALGGLRGRSRGVPPEVNGFWENASFHNYADYAMGAEFRAGLERLRALGGRERCAIMCAEAVWWRCHRRIIADYLLAAGEDVFHIVGSDVPAPAKITPEAVPAAAGILTYPSPQAGLF